MSAIKLFHKRFLWNDKFLIKWLRLLFAYFSECFFVDFFLLSFVRVKVSCLLFSLFNNQLHWAGISAFSFHKNKTVLQKSHSYFLFYFFNYIYFRCVREVRAMNNAQTEEYLFADVAICVRFYLEIYIIYPFNLIRK